MNLDLWPPSSPDGLTTNQLNTKSGDGIIHDATDQRRRGLHVCIRAIGEHSED